MKNYNIRYIAYGKTHVGQYEGSSMANALTAWATEMILKGYATHHFYALKCELIQE